MVLIMVLIDVEKQASSIKGQQKRDRIRRNEWANWLGYGCGRSPRGRAVAAQANPRNETKGGIFQWKLREHSLFEQ